jgi:hypothetical protein
VLGVGQFLNCWMVELQHRCCCWTWVPGPQKVCWFLNWKGWVLAHLVGICKRQGKRLLRRGGQEEVKDWQILSLCWETTKGHYCQSFSEVRRIVLKMQTHLFMNVCVAYDYHLQKHQIWNSKGACIGNAGTFLLESVNSLESFWNNLMKNISSLTL